MSFEQHSGSNKKFAGKLEEPLIGYVMDAYKEKEPNKFGNHNFVLQMKDQDGESFDLVTVGKLTYVAKNILIAKGAEPKTDKVSDEAVAKDAGLVGKLVRITKAGTYKQKSSGKDVTNFTIEVDHTATFPAENDIPF
jgi:hypothetical protein